MNRSPLRPIDQADIDAYARDGVVCLRQVFDRDWIDNLLPIAREILIENKDFGLLPQAPNRYMSRRIDAYRDLAFNSPLGEACGRTMQSKEIRFFYDEFFAKAPQSDSKTVWHSDRGGWPVTGAMTPSFWMPLTPIVKANCLEVMLGTHRNDVTYWNMTPNSRQMIKPEDRINVPNGEAVRNDDKYTFATWDMEPGDVLLVHPWTLHYSSGNPTDDWRIAISVRVFGDDIRWNPRPECVNLAGVSFDEMITGERPEGPLIPLIWSQDGRKDSVDQFPTGFSTTWSPEARERMAARAAARQSGASYEDEVKRRGGASSVAGLGY